MRGLWRSFVPFLLWWPDVDRGTLKADAFAALTGVIVVLPQGVAFATIAGMPPEYGLYAAMIPAIVAAVFGSSRQLVSGPTTAASIVLFSTLSALAVPGSEAYVRYALTLTFTQLGPAALAVTLFALTEAVSISRSLAARTGELVDGNQEFVGQGLSNIVGSFFSAYVATGSFNRSAVNAQAGARTPLAAIIAGVLLIGLVVAVAPLLAYLPMPAMAAILFLVAGGIVDVHHIRTIVRASTADAAVLWTTFAATLLFPLDFAIILGVFLSLIIYLRQASRPSVVVRVPDPREPKRRFSTAGSLPQCPQFAIVRIDGALFFGAVSYVAERLRLIAKHNPLQKHLLVLARSVSYLDVAGAEMLARELRMRRAAGGRIYFHQVKDGPMEILRRGGYRDEIGEENFFLSKAEAIAEVFARLDRGICLRCDARIFNECRALPRLEEGEDDPPRFGAADRGRLEC